jgi:hypothetical protein
MITFIEHEHTGYPLRTRDNTMLSDATLAFAVNWKSSGMILTHKCCYGAGKLYMRLDLNDYGNLTDKQAIEIANALKESNVKILNIAGNSMPHLRSKYTQEGINAKIADCMNKIHRYWPLSATRGGGQSGVDLAGALWSDSIGLPTTVLAPKGWMYRDDNGRDVCSEYGFIKRFPGYDMGDIL